MSCIECTDELCRRYEQEQIRLAGQFSLTDCFDPNELKTAAGVDLACLKDGEVCGRVLRTHEGVKPVFVSAGNNITLETAAALSLPLTDKESHIPVPTRFADLETHIPREELK